MTEKPDPSALSGGEQLVAQGAIVMKFENDSMSAIAIARPRDEAKVKERALRLLDDDPDAAALAYYSIPYKKHSRDGDCTGRADDNCPVEQEVEGIGIDGARELARLWGNNTSRVYFTDEDDDWIRISGIFVDLETNTRVEVPYAVSKVGVGRGGTTAYTLNPQRLAMAVQAGVSKCARNAIVQGLPRHVSRAYYEKAREIVGATTLVDVPKLVEAFATYNVTREQLEGFYGAKLEDLDADRRRNLRGLFVAIRENLVDPQQHFAAGGGSGSSGPGPAGASGGTGGAPSPAAGAKATVKGGAHAPPAEPAAAAEPESPPTPDAVSSAAPTDTAAEPEQRALEGLGL